MFNYYVSSGCIDGTLSTSSVAARTPFYSLSSKPVAGYAYRVVSAEVKIMSLAPVTSQAGTITVATWPAAARISDAAIWDNIRDQPDAHTESALAPLRWTYEPADPSDIIFNTLTDVDGTSPIMAFVADTVTAGTSFRFMLTVNYEFQPTTNTDFF